MTFSTCDTTEHRLFEQFKAIPNNAPASKLVRKYLEFCWSLPYYGSAFFRGQIETPARSITSYFVNFLDDSYLQGDILSRLRIFDVGGMANNENLVLALEWLGEAEKAVRQAP